MKFKKTFLKSNSNFTKSSSIFFKSSFIFTESSSVKQKRNPTVPSFKQAFAEQGCKLITFFLIEEEKKCKTIVLSEKSHTFALAMVLAGSFVCSARLKGNRVRIPNSPAAVSSVGFALHHSHCWTKTMGRRFAKERVRRPACALYFKIWLSRKVRIDMGIKCFSAFVLALLFYRFSFAQDSVATVVLDAVDVRATSLEEKNAQQSVSRLDGQKLRNISASNAGDAAKFLSGVMIKDYGGIGGLKTVSVRGLGSMHTNLLYDGVSINNAQNGQIDLSKFTITNIEEINLSNGNQIINLQTAKSLSAANVLSIETVRPYMEEGKRTKGDVAMSFGSFNTFRASGNLHRKINEKTFISFNTDVTNSEGNYPYTLFYGPNPQDSSSRERRKNNDLFSIKAEANLYSDLSPKSDLKAKAYFFYSNRGLPGPTTLYYINSKQRLWDRDMFLQSVYTYNITDNLRYRTRFKASASHTRYFDPYFNNAQGFREDIYNQTEMYLNNVVCWNKGDRFSLNLTNDLLLNNMKASNNYDFDPLRFTSLTGLVAAYSIGILRLDANVLHTFSKDWAELHKAYRMQNHLSPFLSISMLWKHFELSIFYKNIFRTPTFNDLYYNAVGQVDLNPEKADQYNIHFGFRHKTEEINPQFVNISIELYHNDVTDKIIAVPRDNIFIWSMVNYGKVRMDGVELTADWRYELNKTKNKMTFDLSAVYNFHYAVDNLKESNTYGHQIQYTPRHSANAIAGFGFNTLNVAFTSSFVGKRYTMNQNTERNALKPYWEHSISIGKQFRNFYIKLSCNNITDKQYEVVKSYPMPGRNWNINIKYSF